MKSASTLISSVCYVRCAVTDLRAASRFASEQFGLQPVAASDDGATFRSDGRYHTVSLHRDGGNGASVGVELRSEGAFSEAEVALGTHDFDVRPASDDECKARHVHRALLARDGSGNAIDLVLRPTQSGRRYFPSRDAGIVQLHDVGLRSVASQRDLQFWKLLGAEVRDWVGDIAYLAIDDLHHRVALYPSSRAGLLYAAFEVESFDSIMQNNYFMLESQVKIAQGPGRQPCSNQAFLHVQGPDGLIFSYVNGMSAPGAATRPARQYPLASESLCGWGSESESVPELRVE